MPGHERGGHGRDRGGGTSVAPPGSVARAGPASPSPTGATFTAPS